VGTLRSYREHADPTPRPTYERGLDVAVRLLAPVVPHLAEELWEALGRDGFVVETDWPTATVDRETVEKPPPAGDEHPRGRARHRRGRRHRGPRADRRRRRARLEVRRAGDRHRQRRRQPHLGADAREPHPRAGDDAASYGQDLQANREALERPSRATTRYDALRAASWLIEREFDAPVRVERAADADDAVVRKAEPGRPAIDIVE